MAKPDLIGRAFEEYQNSGGGISDLFALEASVRGLLVGQAVAASLAAVATERQAILKMIEDARWNGVCDSIHGVSALVSAVKARG